MNQLIAIVDDEPDILELVSITLKKAGHTTKTFESAIPFLKFCERSRPALVVLDLMLPDLDGFEVCKKMKASAVLKNIPILMLTARGDETDKVLGLELGADDYLTKPFSVKELAARVKALLRRSAPSAPVTVREFGGLLKIDDDRYTADVKGVDADLTATEFKILQLLSGHPGVVYSRDRILDHLWGDEKAVTDRTVDVHIKHLREKLGKAGDMIKNLRGVGYKFEV